MTGNWFLEAMVVSAGIAIVVTTAWFFFRAFPLKTVRGDQSSGGNDGFTYGDNGSSSDHHHSGHGHHGGHDGGGHSGGSDGGGGGGHGH